MSIASKAAEQPTLEPGVPAGSVQPLARDHALVDKLLEGDEEAFGQLVDRYHQTMLRLAQVFVSQPSVAEEVVQETWLAVIKGLRSFEGRSSLKTWIFRILTNRAKTRGVRESRTVPFSSLDHDSVDEGPAVEPGRFTWVGSWKTPARPWDEDTPEKLLLNDEKRALIEAAIDELPAKQRAVVQLRDIEGWDSGDICNVLEISETNQRVLLHRGRSRVRRVIEAFLDRE